VAIDGLGANAAIVDDRGRVLVERSDAFAKATPRAVAATVVKLIHGTVSSSARGALEVVSVGLSIAGYVNPDSDQVTIRKRFGKPEDHLNWNNVALKEAIASEFVAQGGGAKVPWQAAITVASRSAACVTAESWVGAASGERDVVYLSISDEIEAGLLVDGRIVRGASGRAGAAGWFALSETFREEFAESGSLSVEGGEKAVVRRTIESWRDPGSSLMSRLSVSNPSEMTTAMVIRAARGGDGLATKVIGDLCNWIGRGIADLISTLNPQVVVVGGGLGLALRPFLGDLRREARRWAEPGAGRQCRIVASSLGEKAALIGVARLALLNKP